MKKKQFIDGVAAYGEEEHGAFTKQDLPPLPQSLDYDRFTDSQLEYMAEWWQDARRAVVNELLAFLLRSHLRLRVVLLDKILNHPELTWRRTAEVYGVSNHKLYDVKAQVAKELTQGNPRAESLIFPETRRAHPGRKKPAAGESLDTE